jgi:hypothetical protein
MFGIHEDITDAVQRGITNQKTKGVGTPAISTSKTSVFACPTNGTKLQGDAEISVVAAMGYEDRLLVTIDSRANVAEGATKQIALFDRNKWFARYKGIVHDQDVKVSGSLVAPFDKEYNDYNLVCDRIDNGEFPIMVAIGFKVEFAPSMTKEEKEDALYDLNGKIITIRHGGTAKADNTASLDIRLSDIFVSRKIENNRIGKAISLEVPFQLIDGNVVAECFDFPDGVSLELDLRFSHYLNS